MYYGFGDMREQQPPLSAASTARAAGSAEAPGSPPPFGWLGHGANTLLADTKPDQVEALAVGLATTLAGVRSSTGSLYAAHE